MYENNINWLTLVKLIGKNIILLPLSMDHCDELFEATNDGELWKLWYATVPSPEGMADEIRHRLVSQSNGAMLPCFITLFPLDAIQITSTTATSSLHEKWPILH